MATKKATRKRRGSDGVKIRVRMYRQGLGDCHLVTYYTGAKPVHMLIDCGTLGATTTKVAMKDVVADIVKECNGHLDVLIATHEHRDHVSGFVSQQKTFDMPFKVDRVWLAWTEDANDALAKDIEKYKGDLIETVALAVDAIDPDATAHPKERDAFAAARDGARTLLHFSVDLPANGALAAGLGTSVQEGMSYVTKRAGKSVSFLKPGALLEPDWLPGVRFYVLGPPRNKEALASMGEHGSPDLYELTRQVSADVTKCARFGAKKSELRPYLETLASQDREEFVQSLPFDPRFRLESTAAKQCADQFPAYFAEDQAWRRIDQDWLSSTSEFALQLDSYTNNTSLVLAIELIDDGRVLLFPADAQLGNWLSWHDLQFTVKGDKERKVTATDLLANTVFYKVGHHSSHNATASKKGLELMTHDDLVAFIPVDRAVAMKRQPPWLMPAEKLYARLVEKTAGRVIRSDTGWPEAADRPAHIAKKDWDQARNDAPVTVTDLYVEFVLK